MDVELRDVAWLALVLPQKLVEAHVRWNSRHDGGVHKAETVAAGVVGGLLQALCALPDPLPPREVARHTVGAGDADGVPGRDGRAGPD